METKTVNFDVWPCREQDWRNIYYKRLSYRKACPERKTGDLDNRLNDPKYSDTRYSKVLLYMGSIGLLNNLDRVNNNLRARYDEEICRLEMRSSPYGNDDSWIQWDLAKQLYYFLSIDSPTLNDHYRIANPLVDERLQEEIVLRHIGWECWLPENNNWQIDQPDLSHLLQCRSSVYDDQLASWALVEIGRFLKAR